jgi:hypothetical protein
MLHRLEVCGVEYGIVRFDQEQKRKGREMTFQGKWFTVVVDEIAEVAMTPAPKRSLYVTHKSGTQNVTNYNLDEELQADYEGLVAAMKSVDEAKMGG